MTQLRLMLLRLRLRAQTGLIVAPLYLMLLPAALLSAGCVLASMGIRQLMTWYVRIGLRR
ncbi:hypothetical protein C1N62_21720 (plasmid) [Nissabacter sp. SGAir0207]|nr:hypothetical protein C1N62_21720 [Nissabacter sp. SGAir0207]